MHGRKALIVLVLSAAVGASFATRALAKDDDDPKERDRTGGVLACSLDGVNPAHHPEIFGNPAEARRLGFYQTPDRVWHVVPGCRR